WLSNGMGWFYLLSATGFLLVSVFLIFSRYGSIRLGKDTDRPEFSYLSWFAMLFSAGMGIGLIFWGAAEPLLHFHSPPFA
ncbi:MAG: BCCT family transporter, partial [Exiguobacterium sp.]